MTPTILGQGRQRWLWPSGASAAARSSTPCSQAILNVVDFGMNVQEAIDAPASTTSGCPTGSMPSATGLSPDTIALLRARGARGQGGRRGRRHPGGRGGVAYDAAADMLEGGFDRRAPDGAAIGR